MSKPLIDLIREYGRLCDSRGWHTLFESRAAEDGKPAFAAAAKKRLGVVERRLAQVRKQISAILKEDL